MQIIDIELARAQRSFDSPEPISRRGVGGRDLRLAAGRARRGLQDGRGAPGVAGVVRAHHCQDCPARADLEGVIDYIPLGPGLRITRLNAPHVRLGLKICRSRRRVARRIAFRPAKA
jgi:hypothetical protein